MSQTTEQIQKSDIKDILENSLNGKRPGPEDLLRLLESDDVHLMGLTAGHLTRKQFGKKASFVNNIILNYTNVCITDCKFCAFYRSPGSDDAYTLTLDEIEARVKTSCEMFKIRQVLIQGGHNPNLKIEYYEDAFRMIREKYPTVGVHGLSTSEIDMIARIGAECGADIVKTLYTGDIDSFAKIVKSTPVPIVIAGGPKAKTDLDILQMTEDAMTAGAKGVTYGRNIFAHKTPEKMVEALADIIFRKVTAKEAMKKIE